MSNDHEPQKRKPTDADSASQSEMEEQPTQSSRSQAEILYLQRTLGNRAVAWMLKPTSQAKQGQIQRGVWDWLCGRGGRPAAQQQGQQAPLPGPAAPALNAAPAGGPVVVAPQNVMPAGGGPQQQLQPPAALNAAPAGGPQPQLAPLQLQPPAADAATPASAASSSANSSVATASPTAAPVGGPAADVSGPITTASSSSSSSNSAGSAGGAAGPAAEPAAFKPLFGRRDRYAYYNPASAAAGPAADPAAGPAAPSPYMSGSAAMSNDTSLGATLSDDVLDDNDGGQVGGSLESSLRNWVSSGSYQFAAAAAPSQKRVNIRAANDYDIEFTWENALDHANNQHTIVAHLHIRPNDTDGAAAAGAAPAAPAEKIIDGAGIWIDGKRDSGINWKNIPNSGAFKDYLAQIRK